MRTKMYCLLVFISFWLCSLAAAGDYQVSRRYADNGMLKDFGANIILRGSPEQILKLTRWLDQIAMVPKGYETLVAIFNTPHDLIIQHADHAVFSAGRTAAPMTMNLINGAGESVHIIFDMRSGDSGSHMVFNAGMELIEYSAVQNLYHELAHAMHRMNGTGLYFVSEDQAIKEENIFRRQLAMMQGKPPAQRYRKRGVRIRNIKASDPSNAFSR